MATKTVAEIRAERRAVALSRPSLPVHRPVYIFDKMAYERLIRGSAKGMHEWMEAKKEEGCLWCTTNWYGEPGWQEWVPRFLGSDALQYMPYFLRLIGLEQVHSSEEDQESMLAFVYGCSLPKRPDYPVLLTRTIFVTGNEVVFNAMSGEGAWKKVCTLAHYLFGGSQSPCGGPKRVWPIFNASATDTEPVEECLVPGYKLVPENSLLEGESPFVHPYTGFKIPSPDYVRDVFSEAGWPCVEHQGIVLRPQLGSKEFSD